MYEVKTTDGRTVTLASDLIYWLAGQSSRVVRGLGYDPESVAAAFDAWFIDTHINVPAIAR